MRGIAAILVVFAHLPFIYPQLFPIGIPPLCGMTAMSLFFVLSGAVIHYNYACSIHTNGAQGVYNFISARFSRLFPLYILFIIITYISTMGIAISSNNHILAGSISMTLPSYIFGVQSWWYGACSGQTLTTNFLYGAAAWSISTELFLYLVYIPIALRINFHKIQINHLGLLLIILGIIGRFICTIIADSNILGKYVDIAIDSTGVNYPFNAWFIYFSPYTRFFEFLCGIGIAEIFVRKAYNKWFIYSSFFLFITSLTIFIIHLLIKSFLPNSYLLHFFPTLIATCAILFFTISCFNLRNKLLQHAGLISYSLYLLTTAIDMAGALVYAKHQLSPWISVPVTLFLSFFLAHLSFKYYEMPCKKYVRNTLKKVTEPERSHRSVDAPSLPNSSLHQKW